MPLVDTYVSYVEETIRKFGKTAKLIHKEEIRPQELNYSLASYLEVNIGLIAEFQRAIAEKVDFESQYEEWWDKKFSEKRKEMVAETSSKGKIAVKEIDVEVRLAYPEEYQVWETKHQELTAKVNFLERLVELYKKYDSVLTTLSSNMRSELRSLNLESRMNTNPENVTRNKVRVPRI